MCPCGHVHMTDSEAIHHMDKRIRFETKAEANTRREREFMALSPGERLQWFLNSFEGRVPADPDSVERKGNFVVYKKKDALRGGSE